MTVRVIALRTAISLFFVLLLSILSTGAAFTARSYVTTRAGFTSVGQFGTSLAACGSIVLVGAPDPSLTTGGTAHVFLRNGTNSQAPSWFATRLNPGTLAAGSLFGFAAALSGDVAVVGANGKNAAAYVFTTADSTGTAWVLSAALRGNYTSFGSYVAAGSNGDYVAVCGTSANCSLYERNEGGANRWGCMPHSLVGACWEWH